MRDFLTNLIKALLAIGAPVWKWCAKGGAWVIDHAATAAKMSAFAAGGFITKTADVVEKTANWAGDLTGKVALIPGKLVGSFLGGGGGGMPMPTPKDEDKDHARRMRDVKAITEALQAGRQPLLRPSQIVPFASRAAIGETVRAYASADPHERLGLDLDELPPHIRTWLLTRSEQELVKLAVAGADKCSDVATGRRGIPGVGKPNADSNLNVEEMVSEAAATPHLAMGAPVEALDTEQVGANSSYERMVAERIARTKAAARAHAPAARVVM